MGVVRREGDWRLEKRDEGVYEITYQKETQMRVLTSDASRRERNGLAFDAVPVREVSSYNEAEGIFEEKAHGPSPFGAGISGNTAGGGGFAPAEGNGDIDLSEVPPIGLSFALLTVGGFTVYTFWEDQNSTALLLGIGFLAIGIAPLVYAGYMTRTRGWRSAWEFLVTTEAEAESGSSSSDDTEKTPPPSENLKNTLVFDRADQQCEWCEESYDHLEVHHIEPRSEGGPNEPKNLIVLCPNCHENADREAIPRSKLQAKVERLPEINST